MAIQAQGQIQRAGSSAWEPLFAWREGGAVTLHSTAWPNGTTRFRIQRRNTATGQVTEWGPPRTVTVSNPVVEVDPFFVLDGIPVAIAAGTLRELAPEVSPVTGAVARTWSATAVFAGHEDAQAIRSRASYNLRRSIGWQLRGQGHGDVVVGGRAFGSSVTARLEVQEGGYPSTGRERWHQTLSLLLREQVAS